MNLQFGWKTSVIKPCSVKLIPVGKLAVTKACKVLLIDSIIFRLTVLLCRLNAIEIPTESNSTPYVVFVMKLDSVLISISSTTDWILSMT